MANDTFRESFRGAPGLIRNENRIEPYGPTRRGSNPELAAPASFEHGYPGSTADTRNRV